MNITTIVGRLTKDPEIKYSQGEQSIAYGSYTIACDRPSRKDAETITDFIYCKVVGKTAEFAERYLRKGMKIAINGRIQVDTWKDADGNTKSTTYVQVLQHEFCEGKSSGSTTQYQATPAATTNSDGFMDIPDGIDEELPFA